MGRRNRVSEARAEERAARLARMMQLRLTGYTLKEIGQVFEVTRERIEQLILPEPAVKAEVSLRAKDTCEACGVRLNASTRQYHSEHECPPGGAWDSKLTKMLCLTCHRARHPQTKKEQTR